MNLTLSYPKKMIIEKWSFYFLIIAIIVPSFIDYSKSVVNIYRALLCLPILLLIRWTDLKVFYKNTFFRLFSLLSLYFTISLIWSDGDSLHNMATKILATYAFMLMVLCSAKYNQKKVENFDTIYIVSAIILLISIAIKWSGIGTFFTDDIFGVFGNRNPVSWFTAGATIAAFFRIINNRQLRILFIAAFSILVTSLLLMASRGSILGTAVGMACIILSKCFSSDKSKSYLLYSVIGISIAVLCIQIIAPEYISSLISRADSNRFTIYSIAIEKITSSPTTLLFGQGIASSARITLDNGTIINNFHSVYLNMAFYGGLIALSLFLSCLLIRPYKILTGASKLNQWDAIVFGIMVTLMFDGHRIFEYPGGMLFAFMLPLFLANANDKIDFSEHQKTQSQFVNSPL